MKTTILILLTAVSIAHAFDVEDAKRLLHKKILVPCTGSKLVVETEIQQISPDRKYVKIGGFGWVSVPNVVIASELENKP